MPDMPPHPTPPPNPTLCLPARLAPCHMRAPSASWLYVRERLPDFSPHLPHPHPGALPDGGPAAIWRYVRDSGIMPDYPWSEDERAERREEERRRRRSKGGS